MPAEGFEPTISAGERPQTHSLDRAATGTGMKELNFKIFCYLMLVKVLISAVEREWAVQKGARLCDYVPYHFYWPTSALNCIKLKG